MPKAEQPFDRSQGRRDRGESHVLEITLAWLDERYPASGYRPRQRGELGPLLLACRALDLSYTARRALARKFALAPGAALVLVADAKKRPRPKDERRRKRWRDARFWARMLRADARNSQGEIPEPWNKADGEDDTVRLITAGRASGMHVEDFLSYALESRYVSDDVKDEVADVLFNDEPVHGYEDGVAAQQLKNGYEFFPPRVYQWVEHLEDLVKGSEGASLTLTGECETEGCPSHTVVIDLLPGERGVQWGYTGEAKIDAGEAIAEFLEGGRDLCAVLKTFTQEIDPLLGERVREMTGWTLHVLPECDTVAHEIPADDLMVAHETDPETGERTLDPEYGLVFRDGHDITG